MIKLLELYISFSFLCFRCVGGGNILRFPPNGTDETGNLERGDKKRNEEIFDNLYSLGCDQAGSNKGV